MPFNDTLELIGNTPLVEVRCFNTGKSRLYLKLENQNPGGSIKDRIGLSMIEAAEREGKIGPGSTLIEATAGNTGIGLAVAAAKKGYRLLLVIPDKMSQEKIQHLKALGAEIHVTRSDVGKGDPEYYQDIAERISKEIPNAYFVNQFDNPANALGHETSTAPEIWAQTAHQVDAIAVGVGSGGTLTGLTNFFKRVKPSLDMILADPVGSILVDYINTGKFGKAGSWIVEGVGEDFIPRGTDFSLVKSAYSISDAESLGTIRTLLRKEGILAGSSSGTLIAAAVRYAQEQTEPKTIVTFVCDSGNKYLSKAFNDYWMADAGFIERSEKGTVIDLVSRRFEDRAVVSVKPADKLLTAYSRMKLYDISQVAVIEDNHIVGILHEEDLLLTVTGDGETSFDSTVAEHMSTDLVTLPSTAPINAALPVLEQGMVAIVKDGENFHGIVTRMDFLNHLRRKANHRRG